MIKDYLYELKARWKYTLCCLFLEDDSWDMGAEKVVFCNKWVNEFGVFDSYKDAIEAKK